MPRAVSSDVWTIAVGAVCAAAVLPACASAGAQGTSTSGGPPAGSTVPGSSIGATSVGGTTPGSTTPRSERTRPTVSPSHGGLHSAFVLVLRSRHDLGAHGVRSSDYRVTVRLDSARPSGATCVSRQTHLLRRGAAGQRLRVVLRAGRRGWCRGKYQGAVVFESGPNCPRPGGATTSGPITPCPEFASRRIPAGRFAYWVR